MAFLGLWESAVPFPFVLTWDLFGLGPCFASFSFPYLDVLGGREKEEEKESI
jgi:hypothetical protein